MEIRKSHPNSSIILASLLKRWTTSKSMNISWQMLSHRQTETLARQKKQAGEMQPCIYELERRNKTGCVNMHVSECGWAHYITVTHNSRLKLK